MWEFYHKYFMDFYTKREKPSKDDVLITSITLPDKSKITGKVQYYNHRKKKHYDYINPDFLFYNDTLRYTDKNTHNEYRKIYNKILKAAKYNLKQFKFDVVVYDEIEHFP